MQFLITICCSRCTDYATYVPFASIFPALCCRPWYRYRLPFSFRFDLPVASSPMPLQVRHTKSAFLLKAATSSSSPYLRHPKHFPPRRLYLHWLYVWWSSCTSNSMHSYAVAFRVVRSIAMELFLVLAWNNFQKKIVCQLDFVDQRSATRKCLIWWSLILHFCRRGDCDNVVRSETLSCMSHVSHKGHGNSGLSQLCWDLDWCCSARPLENISLQSRHQRNSVSLLPATWKRANEII